MVYGQARVSADSLARLVTQARIGELPPVLAPAAVWRPVVDEQEATERANAEAARSAWLDRRGALDIDVVNTLRVICQGRTQFSGWIAAEGHNAGILAAATGRAGVLAVARDGQITLKRTPSRRLPEAFVAQIPDAPAGTGSTLSAPLAELRQAAGWRSVATTPIPRNELRLLLQITALPTHGSGELWVALSDNVGRRRQVPQPLRYADTADGRYLNLVSGNWLLVAPATKAELAARLRTMLRQLS